jgi:hypothetical protein
MTGLCCKTSLHAVFRCLLTFHPTCVLNSPSLASQGSQALSCGELLITEEGKEPRKAKLSLYKACPDLDKKRVVNLVLQGGWGPLVLKTHFLVLGF